MAFPGDHLGVSQNSGPDLYRAFDPLLDALRFMEKQRLPVALALKPVYEAEAAAVARERLENFRPRPVGAKIPGDRAELASQMGTGDRILSFHFRVAQNPLNHQCYREP